MKNKLSKLFSYLPIIARYVTKLSELKMVKKKEGAIAFEDLWDKINNGDIKITDECARKIHELPFQRRDEYNFDGSFKKMVVGRDVLGQINILKEHLKYRSIYLSRSRVYPHKHGIPRHQNEK